MPQSTSAVTICQSMTRVSHCIKCSGINCNIEGQAFAPIGHKILSIKGSGADT